MEEEKKYYWVAVNKSSVAACLNVPLARPGVTPTPESLIGFEVAQEAREALRFLLTAPIKKIPAQLTKWQKRGDVKIIVPGSPEPPCNTTVWHEQSGHLA
jgi:hypothetical protein